VAILNFILDVDGVLTDGKFWVSAEGKSHKCFGSHDADALGVLKGYLNVEFITADHRGLAISEARIVREMGYPLTLVPGRERLVWLSERFDNADLIFMGDGLFDAPCLAYAKLGIAPPNSHPYALHAADYITSNSGGSGAVSDACLFIDKHMGLDLFKEFARV